MGTCLPPVVPAVPTFFRRFHGVPRACPLRARSAGPPRPRFRSYCGRRIELRARIIRACLCCTSQGAAGGSGMPTPVWSCGDMWRGSSCSVCPRGRRPLQAASSPVWVGHDAMMISFKLTRVSKSRNFALRASILVFSSSQHGRILKESSSRFLGSKPLV